MGPKEHLKQFGIPVLMDLPVGNNLMDHPNIIVRTDIIDPAYYTNSRLLNLQQLALHFLNNTGPLGDVPSIGSMMSSKKNPDTNFPNLLVFHSFNAVQGNGTSGSMMTIVNNLVIIKSRGVLRLRSASPYIPPKVDPRYYSENEDFENMAEMLKIVFFVLETPKYGLGTIIKLPSFQSIGCPTCPGKYMYECRAGLDCLLLKQTIGSSHHGGTCRMGTANRPDVVVDPQLKAKNLNNLRVCDASIFPELPNANIWSAVLMLSEKCARLIKDCHHLG